jgi:iron complex transport system substrate-binding protein
MSCSKLGIIVCVIVLLLPMKAFPDSLTMKDMAGRTVSVPHDPERIICIGPGTLRLIVYLKAEDKVVGVEGLEKRFPRGRPYWMAHPELHDLPLCGPGGPASINQKPQMETVFKLHPEIIFVTYMSHALADEVQSTLGIPVVVLSYGSFANFDDTVFDALHIAGRVLNRTERAQAVVEFIQTEQKALEQRAGDKPDDEKPGVYVGGIGYRGAHGLESTTQEYAPLDWVKARNLASTLQPQKDSHLFTDKETLLSLNPEIVFVDGGGLSLVNQAYQESPQVYQALQAFQKKRVYTLHPFNWYTTNIGTVITDAYAIGTILYPDAFKDMNLAAKADQVYSFLVGKPVYHLMKEDYGPLGSVAPFLE